MRRGRHQEELSPDIYIWKVSTADDSDDADKEDVILFPDAKLANFQLM